MILIIDTLREDYVSPGPAITKETETPHLVRHFREGFWFPDCQSQSPWTKPSVGTMLTGLYPRVHGALRVQAHTSEPGIAADPLRESLPTLAERLREAGYLTIAVQTNPHLTRELRFDQGFSWFYYENDAPGDWVTDTALEWLEDEFPTAAVNAGTTEASQAPVFAYLHYMDPHLPYVRHKGENYPQYDGPVQDTMVRDDLLRLRFTDSDRSFLEALYRGEVHFVDREVGRLLSRLQTHAIWEDMLVVVLSDHGEEFWDHGRFEHGHTLYDELLRVPLLMGGPWLLRYARTHGSEVSERNTPAHKLDQQVRVIDLMPTLLELANVSIPEYLQGVSFAPLFTDQAVTVASRTSFAEGLLYGQSRLGIRTDRWKLILTRESRSLELYDVLSDPKETESLVGRERDVATRLKGIVEQWYVTNRKLASHFGPGEPIPLDPVQLERLRSLGYLK
jgi:arylsulfatase A-like enzyme